MDESLRRELGEHLRAARADITPPEVGLAGGGRRRAPGLRREEVATLAGVSLAWYTWLEQGRVTTSRQVIDAVCQALRMDTGAHRHALALAGYLPGVALAGEDRATISPGTRMLIDGWPTTPTLALDERLDILTSNPAYRRLWGDPEDLPRQRRNVLLQWASLPSGGARITGDESLLRALYEHFRTAVGHVPEDPRAAEIVRLLHGERPHAAHWWRCRAVADFPPTTVEMTFVEPETEPWRLTYALLRPVADAGVLLFTQTPADTATGRRLGG
ncbi:helix-turn-helix domain-containing protein [Streptomyces oceani]|uniref:HTH cro/C1-type domain-containing protein n=1 Tax=Streptomyces oceani TaxID=1075402 RepID=A0A1E7JXL1_9ACTN|nr:helix-turn-helix transcriptional regulator [Streptomyces oceani]OEU96394.1 hypothetical protein AN216_20555 [Streptomyces oceani]